MKNVALHNLGCKVNSYEIEVMQQFLQEKGYNIVPFDERADIYIVNTCTVTNMADRKSRQMLHRARQKNPDAIVVAVGCYVQTGQEAVEKDECIDLAIGNNRKRDIVEILDEFLKKRGVNIGIQEAGQRDSTLTETERGSKDKTLGNTTILDIGHTHEYEEMTLRQTAEHTRAYIKIQDGCNQFCSYCAIPLARGRVRSRKPEDIIREIKGMVTAGYKEVVLTGIHISSYGIDFDKECGDYSGESRLIELVEQINDIPGVERIRLGSLEPRIVTEENVKRLAALSKVCPQFHLSLQSGCDETLKRMNRHYTTREYGQSVQYLRKAFTNPAVTTDVIVGFPGETEEEFAVTKAFLEQICFYEMHIFKYSKRAGTRAAAMPDQIPDAEKTRRSSELLDMERRQSKDFRSRYLGKEGIVLLEEKKTIKGTEYWIGHTADYVKVAVKASADDLESNQFLKVHIEDFLQDEILLAERKQV